MGKYSYTQKDFEWVAEHFDLCARLNDCDSCLRFTNDWKVGLSHCKKQWDKMLDKVIPYYPIEKYAQTRENHGCTAYDPSDNYFVPYMIKDLLRRL